MTTDNTENSTRDQILDLLHEDGDEAFMERLRSHANALIEKHGHQTDRVDLGEEWEEERRLAEELALRASEAVDYVGEIDDLADWPEDAVTRLQAALSRPVRPFDDTWEPLDDTDATWALRIMARAKQETDRLEAAAADEIARVRHWLKRSKGRPAATYAHFEALMIGYRIRCEENRPDFPKTYKLPTGVLTRRAGSTSYAVVDEKTFVEWALDNDRDAVKVTPLVSTMKAKGSGYEVVGDLKELKKIASKSHLGVSAPIVSPDGEEVPGVQVEIGPDALGAKPE